MADVNKVIKGLECCTFILGKRKCDECPYKPDNGCYQLQDDFHALLKEQEAKIEQLNRFVNGFSRDAMPVVKCKDCAYYADSANCPVFGMDRYGDWFCADGERR